jgi:Mrp family chromosome partitioning ATPase
MNEAATANGAPHAPEQLTNRRAAAGTAVRQPARSAKARRGAEPFEALLWRLQSKQAAGHGDAKTLGLIGCEPDVGATTIAANLAVRASELGLGPVLLVETDGERPRLRKVWKLAAGPGLAEALAGEAALSDCLYAGPAPDLHVIPATAGMRRDVDAWDAAAVDALLAETSADHNLVVFDLPCVEQLNRATLIARSLDQVLLVVRAEHSRGPAARRAADRLLEDGIPLSGAVLNRRRTYVPRLLRRWI